MRKEIRKNYTWHYFDDFDPKTGKCTMQLVLRKAHEATYPHKGSVARKIKNPTHSQVTGLQRKVINKIKKQR